MKDKKMKKLLILDDEPIILEMLVEFFELNEFTVFSASNEFEAKALFENNKDDLDYIILDLLLKDTTSEELFFYIKEKKSDIKVIISSGLSADDCEPAILEKSYKFVKKPYIMEDLLALLK
jgi:DNA-binding NtrC family response regulator